jgi:hypothetical protein
MDWLVCAVSDVLTWIDSPTWGTSTLHVAVQACWILQILAPSNRPYPHIRLLESLILIVTPFEVLVPQLACPIHKFR